jgi:hypothetical protein
MYRKFDGSFFRIVRFGGTKHSLRFTHDCSGGSGSAVIRYGTGDERRGALAWGAWRHSALHGTTSPRTLHVGPSQRRAGQARRFAVIPRPVRPSFSRPSYRGFD